MKSTITEEKIKRLEKKYGNYIDHYSGWLTFERALISVNENIVLEAPTATKSVLSHHPNKYNEKKSSYVVGLN